MKIITQKSIDAFLNAKPFKRDNTEVVILPNVTILKLFGNEIAYLYNDPDRTLSIRNAGWFSKTTKERLNAIPRVSIRQSKGLWYLNGTQWNGQLIDVVESTY
jgi:hypothetical protein